MMASICYRLFKWTPYSFRRNYDKDEVCLRCPHCGGLKFTSVVIDSTDYTVAEEEFICQGCRRRVGYWAYGYFDPCFRFHDRSLPALLERVRWRAAGLPEP